MEGIPNLGIVGNISEEQKEQRRAEYQNKLGDGHLEGFDADLALEIQRSEIPKTENQRNIITSINEITNGMMLEAGVHPYHLPEANFHMLPKEVYSRIVRKETVAGNADYRRQAIFMNESLMNGSDIVFAETAFHELLHLKGKLVVEVNEDEDGKLRETLYRKGVNVRSVQEKLAREANNESFNGLHEAVVVEETMRRFDQIVSDPLFKDELDRLHSERFEKIRKVTAEKKGYKEDEIYWISEDGRRALVFPYPEYRGVYDYLKEQIADEHADDGLSEEEISKEFLKSHFTGHLVTIAKYTEKTFGQGSFRLLGMMKSRESALQVMEWLTKARIRTKKSHDF